MEAESKLLPIKKARDFSKLQRLLCKEKLACDHEFARCIVSEQHEAGWRASAPGMCALHLGGLIKSGSCQLCKLRGRGAFSDFLREGSFCAGELLPLVDLRVHRTVLQGPNAGTGKPSGEKLTSGHPHQFQQDSSCVALRPSYLPTLSASRVCSSYQGRVDLTDTEKSLQAL